MIKDGSAKTELLSTPSHWFGVTFKEDRPGVVAKFQEFADKESTRHLFYNNSRMPGFFRRSNSRSYDLLSSFSFYVPGIGGTLILLVMLLIGACLGNLATALLMFLTDVQTAQDYGMLLSYPAMFLPPIWYASYQSRRNQFFDPGYALTAIISEG